VGTYLTEAELAKRTTTSPARIERLVEIGVLRSDASGRFSPADIQRVQIAAAYEAGGIELEHIAQAISERRMSFEYSDRIYPEASPPSGRTVGELAAELGHDGDLLPDLFTALGLPRPTPDRPLTEADERILPAIFHAWGSEEMSPDATLRAARLLGDAMRRAAEGWVDLFLEAIPLHSEDRVTLTLDELGPRMFEPAMRVAQLFEPMAVWLLRRQMERALNAVNVETMERALEARGPRPRLADPPTIVFADLSGFTQLTEEQGDELAAQHATTLARLAVTSAAMHDGRLVKQLGDGVMLAFERVAPAIEASLALRTSATDAALPPLHIGISAGPVIERDGDYFGRTVNLAARISSAAGPGEILVDQTAVDVAGQVRVVPVGPMELKGISAAIPLFRLVTP
jgi:class 3 adenylate cyclase/DNA-binding transcriptional MerR regulator